MKKTVDIVIFLKNNSPLTIICVRTNLIDHTLKEQHRVIENEPGQVKTSKFNEQK